jgi:hypothetical protein
MSPRERQGGEIPAHRLDIDIDIYLERPYLKVPYLRSHHTSKRLYLERQFREKPNHYIDKPFMQNYNPAFRHT